MSEVEYGAFIAKIIETLEKNGFPENHVALPLEKLYESAFERGLNFNKVLVYLDEKKEISHEKTDEKIIFSKKAPDTVSAGGFDGFNPAKIQEMLAGMGNIPGGAGDMLKQAQDLLSKMPPEQVAEMMRSFQNMSPEKKEELMKQGKDLGIIPE